MNDLRKFLRLAPGERGAALVTIPLIYLVKVLLRFRGYSRTQAALPQFSYSSSMTLARTETIVRKVEGFVGRRELTCLQRSLVVRSLLGEAAEIRFGVKVGDHGETPGFHAWVMMNDETSADGPQSGYLEFRPASDWYGEKLSR